MSAPALFEPADGRVVATALTRGPWDSNAQHGGAPAALLMRAFERLPAAEGLQIARVTYEFLRPVPLGELEVQAEVVRGGRRVQLLEASIRDPAGVEVVRARALQVHGARTRAPLAPSSSPPRAAGGGTANDMRAPFSPMFAPDAIEIRFVEGAFLTRGPSTAWFRMRVPLMAGEAPSPLQRLAAAGDFGNGVSAPISWDDHVFINPDLTLYIERPPRGEWICLDAQTRIPEHGVGMAESVLYDEQGRVGRAIQALLVAPR
jgi:hypothetical protein